MYIRQRDLHAVSRLWSELAHYPASQSHEALVYCLERLMEIIGASNASWVAPLRDSHIRPRDPLQGWRLSDIHVVHDAEAHARQNQAILRQFETAVVDPQSAAMIEHAGTTRVQLRSAVIDDAAWERSWLYQDILRPLHVTDRLVGSHAVTRWAESYFALDRGPGDPPFDARARDVLALFLAGVPSFHREQLLVRGSHDAYERLTPREQDVMRLLMTDLTEPEIADTLGLTFNTTHQYVIAVFRKFRVQGRAGLTSLWLRYRPPNPPDQ